MKKEPVITGFGFTLVEMTLAIAVVSFGLVAMLTVFSNIFRSSVYNDQTLIAGDLVNERLEQLIAQKEMNGYASIPTGVTIESPVTNYPSFSRTTTIGLVTPSGTTFVPSGADVGYKQISVTIDGFGQSQTATTLITNWVPL